MIQSTLSFSKSKYFIPLVLLIWTFLLRFPAFGDPLIGTDPDWYLYVGGQMLRGYFPYIDLWDRKPVGLFALYAPFNFFGPYRFWAYQIGASIFAFLTAWLIFKVGENLTAKTEGLMAALIYLPFLNALSGYGGREAVFYNLLVTAAFAIVLLRFEKLKEDSALLFKTGAVAMLLFGVTIEIKPTVFLEGAYLGTTLLYFCWYQTKSCKNLFFYGASWIYLALLPTFFIISCYALAGDWQEWYFANVISIFQQKRPLSLRNFMTTAGVFALAAASFLFAFKNLQNKATLPQKQTLYFIGGWSFVSAAMISLLMGGTRFALAFLPVFCLIFTFTLYKNPIRNRLFALSFVTITIVSEIALYKNLTSFEDKSLYWAHQKLISQRSGCLFIYGGDEIQDITEATANCHLTRYPYPGHLGEEEELGALGIKDETLEILHILEQKPIWISIGAPIFNPSKSLSPKIQDQYRILQKDLQAHYHLARTEKPNKDGTGLYERNESP